MQEVELQHGAVTLQLKLQELNLLLHFMEPIILIIK